MGDDFGTQRNNVSTSCLFCASSRIAGGRMAESGRIAAKDATARAASER